MCDICHHWYFLDKGFKFQPNVYNGCYDLLMLFMNLIDIAILNIEVTDYCCIIIETSRSEAINVLQKADLNGKSGTL